MSYISKSDSINNCTYEHRKIGYLHSYVWMHVSNKRKYLVSENVINRVLNVIRVYKYIIHSFVIQVFNILYMLYIECHARKFHLTNATTKEKKMMDV